MVSPTSKAVQSPRRVRRPLARGSNIAPKPGFRTTTGRILGPAGLSLACHGVVLVLFTLVTWATGSQGDGLNTEYKAQIVTRDDGASSDGGFRFPDAAPIDRKKDLRGDTAMQDLASLLQQDESFQVAPVDVGDTGLKTLAVDTLRRADVVETPIAGVSEAEAFGGDLGERDLAGGGPVGTLWGVGKGQRARSIVYVMDRSGSMTETISLLQRELLRAIGSLEPDQLFNVIWFNEGRATEWSTRMRKATFGNKREAFEAIKRIVAAGQTEPMDAVRRGLGYEPDVLFLLSDGDFGEENDRIIELIKKRNRRKNTIINTILFVYDTAGDGERVLRAIADTNNGKYKHVTEKDVYRR